MTPNGRKIHEQILALLGSADYRPLDKNELAKALGRKSGVRMGLNQALRDLERAGEIARIRKNRYVLPPAADLVTGKLHIHQAGYGFLISEKPGNSHARRPRGCSHLAGCALRTHQRTTRGTRDSNFRTRTRYDRRNAATFAQFLLRCSR